MKEKKVHIDNLYRDKQEQFTELPTAAWDAMEQKLAGPAAPAAIPEPRNNWLRYILIAAVAALVIGYMGYMLSKEGDGKDVIKHNTIEENRMITYDNAEIVNRKKAIETKNNERLKEVKKEVKIDKVNTISARTVKMEDRKTTEVSKIDNMLESNILDIKPSRVLDTIQSLNLKQLQAIIFPFWGKPGKLNETRVFPVQSVQTQLKVIDKRVEPNRNIAATTTTAAATQQAGAKNIIRGQGFSFGIKAGYESGLAKASINKFVGAPYLQYNFSDKWSLTFQPTIKSGSAAHLSSGPDETYYRVTDVTSDTGIVFLGGPVALEIRVRSQQQYDSIIASYQYTKKLLEFELPLILRHNLKNGLGFAAGITVTTGKTISLTESKRTFSGLTQRDSLSVSTPNNPPAADSTILFYHTAKVYDPFASSPGINTLRLGYMLGISYTRNRFMLELSIQQYLSGLSKLKNESVRNSYTQPYYRLMLGYRLSR